MLVTKHVFRAGEVALECGATLPVQMGYETYGTLSPERDNAILISHYFSATSHCAGKYHEEDSAPGYWDALIGPGKAVDTDRFFVLSTDNLCNTQANNPAVFTTGPATINPATGRPYGLRFPVVGTRDMVTVQKRLLDHLGIHHLHAVMGASAGGMISFQWAVHEPDWMDRCIGVVTNVQHPILTCFNVLQQALRAGRMDPHFCAGDYYGNDQQPVEGLRLAAQMMIVGAYTPAYFERTYPRNSFDTEPYTDVMGMAGYEKALYDQTALGTAMADLNHWIYTCRMTMNHDIAHGFPSLDDALSRIRAKVLMIPNKQDHLHPWQMNRKTVTRLNELGKTAELYPIDSDYGHMAGIQQAELFADKIQVFLNT